LLGCAYRGNERKRKRVLRLVTALCDAKFELAKLKCLR